jgi:uncharacterized protein Yka (UPF0111/DUF47 family)
MTQLPTVDSTDLPSRADLSAMEANLMSVLERLSSRVEHIEHRFDRMYHTLIAGLFVIVAAMAGVLFATL